MHKFRLETWSSFSFLLESYGGTWVVTSKTKSRSTSNQCNNCGISLFLDNFKKRTGNEIILEELCTLAKHKDLNIVIGYFWWHRNPPSSIRL